MMDKRISLKKHPEPCPGAYVMHFYCKWDNPQHGLLGDDEFYSPTDVHTRAQAIAKARAEGWSFHYKDRTATCPKCNAS